VARIQLQGITKRFGPVTAIRDFSLTVEDREFLAILGPSGCGKTTLLRLIAGFETLTEGNILLDGRSIDELPPNRRNLGMVFQSYALFPHKTVYQNVEFGLRMRGVVQAERERRVMEALELVRLADARDRYPSQISGGQQQRVALARAVVIEPPLLLLDEPLGALDRKLREEMQIEIKNLHRQLGVTALYVTHDQEEALTMADRIAVMNEGSLEQVAPPLEMYERPATPFVANFIGTSNLLWGQVKELEENAVLEWEGGLIKARKGPDLGVGDTAFLAIRPEKVVLTSDPQGLDNCFTAVITDAIYLGASTTYLVEVEGFSRKVVASVQNTRAASPYSSGSQVWLGWDVSSAPPLGKSK
jgi:spermidine/putrescine ABC transporter ATP-binding subunit